MIVRVRKCSGLCVHLLKSINVNLDANGSPALSRGHASERERVNGRAREFMAVTDAALQQWDSMYPCVSMWVHACPCERVNVTDFLSDPNCLSVRPPDRPSICLSVHCFVTFYTFWQPVQQNRTSDTERPVSICLSLESGTCNTLSLDDLSELADSLMDIKLPR